MDKQGQLKLGFFGMHYDLHANEKDLALGSETTFEHIYTELSKIKPDFVQYDCKGHPGYAGYPTKVGIPAPGLVNDALRVWRDVSEKLNIPLLVHYSGLWDMQAAKNHPEWAMVNAENMRSKDYICHNSSYNENYMIPQLLEVIDWYDVDGFWVDGENWASFPCYCEECIELFKAETGINEIPKSKNELNWDKWLLFHRKSFERHVKLYTDAIHERKPNCLVCSNWMYSVSQPDEVSLPIDFLSGDSSPSWGCERATLEGRYIDSHGINWNLMIWGSFTNSLLDSGWTYPAWTFKTIEAMQQESASIMMNGGSVVIYDTPQRTGHLIGWRQDILAKVADFCQKRRSVCEGTKSFPQVALVHNSIDYYAKNGPLYLVEEANRALEGGIQILLENHCHVDILNEIAIQKHINKYPVVVIPEPLNLPENFVDVCKDYVINGGNLLISGGNGALIFSELLGIQPDGEPANDVYSMEVGNEAVSAGGLWQKVRPIEAQTISYLCSGEEVDKDRQQYPAATVNCLGKGKVIGVYGPVFEFYATNPYPRLRKFFGGIISEFSNPNLIKVEAPARVEISMRTKDNNLMVNLLNKGVGHPLSRKNHAVEEIPPVGPIKLKIPLAKEPVKVYLAPEDTGISYKWTNGFLEAKIEFINDHIVIVIEKSE